MNADEIWDDEVRIDSPLGFVRDGFLRYFIILSSSKEISELHQTLLLDAIQEIEEGGCLVSETIECKDFYAVLSVGISAKVAPQTVIDEIIIAANSLDPFLRFHFFITNTHAPTEKERIYIEPNVIFYGSAQPS